ncbi:SLC13 family permease [Rehaibacterium terrae]|jgi:di/tricarboxylate transporter|uniref:Di/tricarboxylate transporter n=1 Tax=Rehaibacterium terrae TaxID=1341696 RepID=A0A7W7XZM2_9GAMM|nr:SLC13 family permease [Rehaibacterium terrae]MBB5015401.1 di/tricarboxylate transporter [Rehaibacterium terrae]
MGLEAILTLLVLAGAITLFATEKLPVDVVAMLILATLLVLGLVTPAEALAGFSSQATITVAAMFVLSAGLMRTGALRVVTRLLSRIRNSWLFTLTVMLALGGMSAFVNNTAALAVFLPVVLTVAAANRFSASKILIPMSYAAQMGGVCTLIGTSTNLLVHALAQDLGEPGFSLFEFAPLGLITMAAGLVYLMIVGPLVLPDRRGAELTENYELGKYITELRVTPESPLVGKTVAEAKLGEKYGVYVLELLRGKEKVWSPRAQKLEAEDVLLVRGDWSRLSTLKERARLEIEPEFQLRDEQFQGEDQVLAEVMIAPGSRFVGHTLAELDFQWHHNATVLAIHRRGQVLREQLKDVKLTVGDILLMLTPAEEMRALRANPGFVVLSEREDESASRRKAWIAIAIMVAVVGVAFLEWLPIVASAILGCIGLVVFRCLEPDEVYEAIDWRVIILLAGVLPMGIALQKTGAAGFVAQQAVALVGGWGPIAALAAIYLITATLTEAMSNNAAAVLMAPIAVAAAHAVGADATPFLVAVAFAASTSFATPVGYQTNTMVYNAGGYRFTDFVRIGVPLNLLFWAIAVYFIPRFWPL